MGAPIWRLDGVAAPTYGKDSPFFTVELIHGGFFHGSGNNRFPYQGLIKAVRELFSDSPHRFCVRHLWQNFNKSFKGEALKNQLWKCARSSTEGQFRQNMNEMLVLNKEAHDWLEELAPPTWVKAYQNDFPKCDVLLNNNCEVFNKYILEAREMPIISMCQRIKGQCMGRTYGKQQEPIKWHGSICPKIRKKLDRNVEAARTCLASPAGKGMFVVNNRGVDFSVDTVTEKCSCRRWDLSGIPCCHGVSALRFNKIPPEDRVNSCYSIVTYCKAYEHIIMPCRDVTEWAKMNGRHITPPPLRKQRGRRRINRRKQPEEKEGKKGVKINKKGAIIHCSYCGIAGHNKGGCMDYKLGLKPKKKFARVRAEPDVSSSDEEETLTAQEQNQQTEGIVPHEQQHYEAEIIANLTQERVSSQREPVAHGPLPENYFIQMHAPPQQPTVPTTATKEGNVHRKREVLAIAKLRAAAEKREIADQAKFDAAMAKLKEEEEKLLQAAQKRKDELLAKKQAAEEKKKEILEEKRIVAEEKRKASEEKKKIAQGHKLAMAEKRRQSMDERKKNAVISRQRKAEEKKKLADEKRMIARTSFQQEEAEFLLHQANEEERHMGWQQFKEAGEAARQQAWDMRNNHGDTTRNEEWEQRKRKAEERNDILADQAKKLAMEDHMKKQTTANNSKAEEERLHSSQFKRNNPKKTGASSNQSSLRLKKPGRVSMFDEFR